MDWSEEKLIRRTLITKTVGTHYRTFIFINLIWHEGASGISLWLCVPISSKLGLLPYKHRNTDKFMR